MAFVIDDAMVAYLAIAAAAASAGGAALSSRASMRALKKQREQQSRQYMQEQTAENNRTRRAVESSYQQQQFRSQQNDLLRNQLNALSASKAKQGIDDAAMKRTDNAIKAVDQQAAVGRGEPSSGVQGRISEDFQKSVGSAGEKAKANAADLAAIFGQIGGAQDNLRRENGLIGNLGTNMGRINQQAASARNIANGEINSIQPGIVPTMDINPYSNTGMLLTTVGGIGQAVAGGMAGRNKSKYPKMKKGGSVSGWNGWLDGNNGAFKQNQGVWK